MEQTLFQSFILKENSSFHLLVIPYRPKPKELSLFDIVIKTFEGESCSIFVKYVNIIDEGIAEK